MLRCTQSPQLPSRTLCSPHACRDMLALTARVSSAAARLADLSLVPGEGQVDLAAKLCHLLRLLGDGGADCAQCAVLLEFVEVVAGAVARALVRP